MTGGRYNGTDMEWYVNGIYYPSLREAQEASKRFIAEQRAKKK